MTTDLSFGHWLRRRRLVQNLTQKGLALAVGCAVITIQKIEAGERAPSAQMAEQIAAALGLAAEDAAAFVTFARGDGGQPHPASWHRRTSKTQPPRHNIPYSLSPLHGRDRELALITSRLRQGQRLLTLTGPPGIGKTRLAIEVAHTLLRDFTDGVYFVALETAAEAEMVVPAIVQALSLRPAGDLLLPAQLVAGLRDRHLLLVLDNFEHLLPAAAAVATLLANCPWLSILATSRVPLHLPGEAQVEIMPLAVPSDGTPADVLRQYPSTALFIERAAAVRADFGPTGENAAALAQICRQLDGLPLAIELVAGQINLLPPAQLLAQLQAHTDWLLSLEERRTLSLRPVNLRAAIDASLELLDPTEKDLLAALSVFVGGFNLAAAEAVAGRQATLANLGALRDKSLLQGRAAAGDAPRFSMLSVVRGHVLEALAARESQAIAARRHAAYFVDLAESGAAKLHGAGQVAWLEQLLTELDNFRAAFNWLLAAGELAQAVRLVVALGPLWNERSLLVEARQAVTRLRLALSESGSRLPPRLAVRLDNMQGSLAYYEGDGPAAADCFQQALERAEGQEDRREMAYALDGLAAVALAQERYKEAEGYGARSLDLSRAAGDDWLAAITLLILGEIARHQCNPADSDEFYRESLGILRTVGDRSFAAIALHNLGQVAMDQGDVAQAAAFQKEGLALAQAVMNYRLIARILERLAEIALARQQADRAARLLGAAAELRRAHGIIAQPTEQEDRVAVTAGVQQVLGQAYAQKLSEGGDMTLGESVRLALEEG